MAARTARNTGQGSLSATQVAELFTLLRSTGDRDVRERLIVEHRWIAEQCARRFRHRGEPDADLLQVAYLGLIKATDRYDPGRGVPFHGYAIPTILGELKRHFRDTTWAVGVPRRSKDLLPTLSAATDRLHQQLGRSPTVAELAEQMGVPTEVVVQAIEARGANRVRGLPPDSPSCVDIDDPTDTVENSVIALGAVAELDERSRTILLWRYYEECTQREIGERLGIGQVQVSRLLKSALATLRGGAA